MSADEPPDFSRVLLREETPEERAAAQEAKANGAAVTFTLDEVLTMLTNATDEYAARQALKGKRAPTTSLTLTWARDYAQQPRPRFLVGNLLESGSLACVYGETNCGKTTLAIDLVVTCTRGMPWRGRRTRTAVAVYLPLEGARGVRERIRAKILRDDIPEELLFADLTGRGLSLMDPVKVAEVLAILRAQQAKHPDLELILIVDTVARAMAGGDENSSLDMGRLIAACDAIRVEIPTCTVLLIHHTGKDSAKGARGHSSLRGAVDTEIEVAGTVNPRTATVRKQRDLPSGDVFAFDLDPVDLGTDPETFDPISACVVVHRDYMPPERQPTGKNQQTILRALRNRQQEADAPLVWTLADLRKIGRDLGQTKDSARTAVDGLTINGFLTPTVGGHRLADGQGL